MELLFQQKLCFFLHIPEEERLSGHLHKNEGEVVTAGDGEMLASEHGPNEELL